MNRTPSRTRNEKDREKTGIDKFTKEVLPMIQGKLSSDSPADIKTMNSALSQFSRDPLQQSFFPRKERIVLPGQLVTRSVDDKTHFKYSAEPGPSGVEMISGTSYG